MKDLLFLLQQRFEKSIYLLLIFLLPTQLGKHFWPEFSFIGGLRVDYLSPTIYTTDILIIILVTLCLYRWIIASRHSGKRSASRILDRIDSGQARMTIVGTGVFISMLLVGIFFAKNQPVAIYGLVRVLEMTFFAWYTARVVGKSISLVSVGYALGASVLFESCLAIAQFVSQGSLNGVFYFFGERNFSTITPGIANASIGGHLILRPYGTLPHPNVLAGFLLIASIFLVSLWNDYLLMPKHRHSGKSLDALWVQRLYQNPDSGQARMTTLIKPWVFVGVLLLGSVALFLTLSRTTIALFVCFTVFGIGMFLKRKTRFRLWGRNDKVVWGLSLLGIVGLLLGVRSVLPLLWGRFLTTSFLEESFVMRADLFKNAWWMIQNHPVFGVGLMNFLVQLPPYQHTQSFYLSLQPVHNIWMLILSEVGVIGFTLILWFLFHTVRHVYRGTKTPLRSACFFMLGGIFFLGMFDHYFLTLQQGQLLFAFVLGLCWSLSHKVGKRR